MTSFSLDDWAEQGIKIVWTGVSNVKLTKTVTISMKETEKLLKFV